MDRFKNMRVTLSPSHLDPAVVSSIGEFADANRALGRLIMGNTAQAMLRSVDGTLLAVKPKGLESPVRVPEHSSSVVTPEGEAIVSRTTAETV